MQVSNAHQPTREQMRALQQQDSGEPIYMLNLLKFREQAAYADGRATALSGEEAYAIYGRAMTRMVLEAGGKLVFSGRVEGTMVGVVEESWDSVAVMMYPSLAVMGQITGSAAYAEIHVHRDAGLAGQILIKTSKP
jgi:uncharacterized protein (DUF1330 family)